MPTFFIKQLPKFDKNIVFSWYNLIKIQMGILEAPYTGVIKLGEFELPCYVLNDGARVLSQREVVKLISGGRSSGDLGQYLSAKSIQPYLPEKFQIKDNLLEINTGSTLEKTDKISPINKSNALIFNVGSHRVNGIIASDIVDICNAYLRARQDGALQPNQGKIAEQCEIFISACAKTGIDAIIDEATGYQYYRNAESLQERFKAYLQDEYREWTLSFPRQFFMQLYRLEQKNPPIKINKYPLRFGKYVMQFVYDTLDPDIADYLRKNNPKPGGRHHHHQLFNDTGYKDLMGHLMSVLGIMKASTNMERFKENIAIAFPNARTQRRARFESNRAKVDNVDKKEMKVTELSLFDILPTIDAQ